jgi:tungstate transport system permease protein
MILVQIFLVLPIVAALTKEVIEDTWVEYQPLFQSLCVDRLTSIQAMLWDTRTSLLTVAMAGFARAISEVGAVIVVGGNINHLTRVMTTAIALETSKGELAMALALGMILLLIALGVNATVYSVRRQAAV